MKNTVAARWGGQEGAIAPGRQRERAPKEGGCSQGRGDKYDKYDICPRAPETLAPPLTKHLFIYLFIYLNAQQAYCHEKINKWNKIRKTITFLMLLSCVIKAEL
jgi:hypothetical protein